MADERPTTQQLFDEALARYAANKQKMLVDVAPDLVRVQALAAAVQAEQLTRIADWLDSATVHTVDGPAVRTR